MNPRVIPIIAALAMTVGTGCWNFVSANPVPVMTTPSPSPTAIPSTAIEPRVGRVYTFSVAQTNPNGSMTLSQQTVSVKTLAGDTATYDLTTTLVGRSPGPAQAGLTAKRTHGVFWIGALPDPLTQDASTYPVQTFNSGIPPAVNAGMGPFVGTVANVDASVYYFVGSVLVRASTPTFQIYLQSVKG